METYRIWSEIRNDGAFDGDTFLIVAWLTDDVNEDGRVIAQVNKLTGHVEYFDERARTDTYAQKMIKEVLL